MWGMSLSEQQILNVQGWRQFEGHIPADEKANLVAAYHKRLTSQDTAVRDAAVSMPLFVMCFVQNLPLFVMCFVQNLIAGPAALEKAMFCKSLVQLHKGVQYPLAPCRICHDNQCSA